MSRRHGVPYFVDVGAGAFNLDGTTFGSPDEYPATVGFAAPAPPAGGPAVSKASSSPATAEAPTSPDPKGRRPDPSATAEDLDDMNDADESESREQHMMDHAVFDPNCAVCIASKKTRKQHRSKKNRKISHPSLSPKRVRRQVHV